MWPLIVELHLDRDLTRTNSVPHPPSCSGPSIDIMTFKKDLISPSLPKLDLGRNKVRSLLKKSGDRNSCAFTQAAACYIEFLSEYFYLLGFTTVDARLEEIRLTLIRCWQYTPYIRRVSDFERFLQIQLERSTHVPSFDLSENIYHTINDLDHGQRFLLVARNYQDWSYRALHLATRIKKNEITHALTKLKCVLTGFDPEKLSDSEWELLLQVNDLIEGELKTHEIRAIEKAIAKRPLILKFKADWLQFRCGLAEIKELMLIGPERIDEFKKSLTEDLDSIPVKQPKLRDALINQISFTRIPSV